jgi:hypothetical protein
MWMFGILAVAPTAIIEHGSENFRGRTNLELCKSSEYERCLQRGLGTKISLAGQRAQEIPGCAKRPRPLVIFE